MNTCRHPGCETRIVNESHGKPGRPRRYCPEHSTGKARASRARKDTKRFPCGCKTSGKYSNCPQHGEHTEGIRWGNPDPYHSEYAAVPPKATHKGTSEEALERMAVKAYIRHERMGVRGQWLIQEYSTGERIPVIGQWDLTQDWEPVNPDWRSGVDFTISV